MLINFVKFSSVNHKILFYLIIINYNNIYSAYSYLDTIGTIKKGEPPSGFSSYII